MSPHAADLLLIAHGTRDPRGAEEMQTLLGHVRAQLGVRVEAAWLEDFADPDAVTAAGRLRAQGTRRLITLPLLLLGAGHAKTDVPGAVSDLRTAFDDLTVTHARVLGLHPALFALARARLDAVSAPDARADEALLVTGAGSSDPDANGDLAKAARFLAETSGHRWAEIAFAGVSWPTADVALRRLHDAGVQRVTHFSWSLLAGLLERRVTGWLDEVGAETGLVIRDAGRFGPDPLVAEAVAGRYHEALDGDARMNCDLCQYRLPLPGRERREGARSAGGTGERVHRAR
ncbi:MAG: sirohydrochlorin chelatase [Egibacteraceae bacterium]